jgi:hypothetical protein
VVAAELLDERDQPLGVVDVGDDVAERGQQPVPLATHGRREQRAESRVEREQRGVEVCGDLVTQPRRLCPARLQRGDVH